VDQNKSVDEILKQIVIDACEDYLEKDVKKRGARTQKALAHRTGISESTLDRILDAEKKSYPSLVEAMEILKAVNKREHLMAFAERSQTQAALLIKEFYPQFIKNHQIVSTNDVNEAASNQEILSLINEHQVVLDTKLKTHWKWVIGTLGAWLLAGYLVVVWYLVSINANVEKLVP